MSKDISQTGYAIFMGIRKERREKGEGRGRREGGKGRREG